MVEKWQIAPLLPQNPKECAKLGFFFVKKTVSTKKLLLFLKLFKKKL